MAGSLDRSECTAPTFSGDAVAIEVPGLIHHQLEVVVTVNAHGDVVVVLDPLGWCDFAVTLVFRVCLVMQLEGV